MSSVTKRPISQNTLGCRNEGKAHWRSAVNARIRATAPVTCGTAPDEGNGRVYALLPNEIQDEIDRYLDVVDRICLAQTCQRFRHASEAKHVLNGYEAHAVRTRLDRYYFPVLCMLECAGHLDPNTSVCSFCQILHPRWLFTAHQLDTAADKRTCFLATRKYLLCGNLWATPAELRALIEHLAVFAETDTILLTPPVSRTSAGSQVMAHKLYNTFTDRLWAFDFKTQIALENSQDGGLTLIHEFCFGSGGPGVCDRLMSVCPHLTVGDVMDELGVSLRVESRASCVRGGCNTAYGGFIMRNHKCVGFRVQRKFGWVENLEQHEFWRKQTCDAAVIRDYGDCSITDIRDPGATEKSMPKKRLA